MAKIDSVHTFGGGGDHCGDPPQTIAVGSHLRQSPRKKLWGVTSGSPPTAIVSGDSPQRVLSAMERVVHAVFEFFDQKLIR